MTAAIAKVFGDGAAFHIHLLCGHKLSRLREEIILNDCSPSADAGGSGRRNRPRLYDFFGARRRRASIHPRNARSEGITALLRAWGGGDEAALSQLAEQVYPELRLMARRFMKNERHANTLQTTALVHEVYLRLVDVTMV